MSTAPQQPRTPLCCPNPFCGSTVLATLEVLSGEALTSGMFRKPDGEVDYDHTGESVVDWNSMSTVGVCCRECGWLYQGQDWASKLAEVTPEIDDLIDS